MITPEISQAATPLSEVKQAVKIVLDEFVDKAISAPDMETSAGFLADADRIVQNAAYVLPLFQLPTALIYRDKIVNLRDNPNQVGPAYNTGEWGLAE